MKKTALIASLLISIGIWVIGADHVDAPAVGSLTEGSSLADIADLYAFESPANSENYVFVVTASGLLPPSGTGDVSFDENVMYEFNIDNDADNVEDLVIQCRVRNGMLHVYGPIAPSESGRDSKLVRTANLTRVEVTPYNESPKVGSNNGVKAFAGPSDDPFFFDLFQFRSIVNGVGASLGDENNTGVYDPERLNGDGEPYPAGFLPAEEATDALAGTNVMSIVVEVPKTMLGTADNFSVWSESKIKM
ncbi:DUF4331 family protein [Flexithrix dorotheae]|uniref:DUF4331 family protein n=1 Tax=Flexithrix dorotheae TaxID=70993 RepID=UPI000375DDDD|nr:DUF4331 family protein [Flexithrix dorotheae]